MNDIIYLDLECLLLKYDTCSNSPIQSHAKIMQFMKHVVILQPSKGIILKKKTTSYYRGKDCISKLCTELCEKATELFNTEMLPMDPLTFEEQQKYNDSRECYICKKKFIFDKKSNYYKIL